MNGSSHAQSEANDDLAFSVLEHRRNRLLTLDENATDRHGLATYRPARIQHVLCSATDATDFSYNHPLSRAHARTRLRLGCPKSPWRLWSGFIRAGFALGSPWQVRGRSVAKPAIQLLNGGMLCV
jgi:hypothetical protein